MIKKVLYFQAGYKPAKCCRPEPQHPIRGYYSYDKEVIVHRANCRNLDKAEEARIVNLNWADILLPPPEGPGADFGQLLELDFRVLNHHARYGVDYSLKIAQVLHSSKQEIFDSHAKLRAMGLLERVEPVMIQYRPKVADNKWIKHRNHTYYQLTNKGRLYLEYHHDMNI